MTTSSSDERAPWALVLSVLAAMAAFVAFGIWGEVLFAWVP